MSDRDTYKLIDAKEEIRRLREALEFYADPVLYKQLPVRRPDYDGYITIYPKDLYTDKGEVARITLEKELDL